jgi:hypothetical protein
MGRGGLRVVAVEVVVRACVQEGDVRTGTER